tara:strand:+ start:2092 stop:2772 length:681 start_codon:yes stop_codon:yes gene_type:complete
MRRADFNFTQRRGTTLKNIWSKWIAGLAIAVSQTSWAVPITDVVVKDGREWAQVNLFTAISWGTINEQCPAGSCAPGSEINGYDLEGWTWASISAVQALFNQYTGQSTKAPGDYYEVNSTWGPAFVLDFDPTLIVGSGSVTAGWSSTRDPRSNVAAYTPFMRYSIDPRLTDSVDSSLPFNMSIPRQDIGAWFFRDASQVPSSATLTLFSLGMASLWMTRRKRGAKV